MGRIRSLMPPAYNNYYEPFLGGGAVLLELRPQSAVVNDVNTELVNMYMQVRENVEEVLAQLRELDAQHEAAPDAKLFYCAIRASFNENMNTGSPAQAARFIYLNKHCFNGLYRVNSKGTFNVPFNYKRAGASFQEGDVREVSQYLRGVQILNEDFESAVAAADKGDFVFLDSPYVPLTETSFVSYNKDGFGHDEHVRLSNVYKQLSDKGVFCMLTNHNTPLVNQLYSDYVRTVVPVARNINSKGTARKGEEIIITNY